MARRAISSTAVSLATIIALSLVAGGVAAAIAHDEPAPIVTAAVPRIVDGPLQWEADPYHVDGTLNHRRVEDIRDWGAALERNAAAAQARRTPSRGATTPRGGSHRGYATWYECTSMVENGGDYGRSTNRSHFGRYQFSRSTWVTFGGRAETWGYATPEEQDRVFANAVAQGAESHWRPYNGC